MQTHSRFAAALAFCLPLALGGAAAAEDADAERSLTYERDKTVTHNDDGSVTVDKSWEKTHEESGKTANGSSSTTHTKSDDGVSYDRDGERTTFGGTTFESDGSGSRTRGDDGSLDVQRENTVTNTETGNSRTRESGRTRTPNGDGTGSFSRYNDVTRRNPDGDVTGSRSSSGSGTWQRNDHGGRSWRYDGSTSNDRGRSSDVTRQGRSFREDGSQGRQVRSERTFDDGRSVTRGHETRVKRDRRHVQRQDRHRTKRTPPSRH